MTEQTSHRQILRSTSIIGGASVLNIVIGLVRGKVSALILGPSGVGLVGLLLSLLATSSMIAGLGFSSVGTRQIAEAVGREDEAAIAVARRALVLGTAGLAMIGATVFWLFRMPIARYALSDAGRAGDVGWLAVALALTVAAASQSALLNGLRRTGDIARVSVISSAVATAVGIGVLIIFGAHGLIAYVLISPMATFAVGHLYVARLPKMQTPTITLAELTRQWWGLVRLGAAFMLAGLASGVAQLIVRWLIERRLGLGALGQFQAAFSISMTYIGFILGAMSMDYYPRLTAAIRDSQAAKRMVNEQTEVALMLAGPVFVAMMGLAPWVIQVLYSGQFAEAAAVLRWQILGDILKVASWPLGYVILATGDGAIFLATECLALITFALLTWVFLPLCRLEATGISFFAMYLIYLPVVYFLAMRRMNFSWSRRVVWQFGTIFGLACLVAFSTILGPAYGALFGCLAAAFLSIDAIRRLRHVVTIPGALNAIRRRLFPSSV